MFDFAWSELAVIGVVALLVIGPKDLPGAIKGIGEFVRKARRMASEFQTHVDDMVKDANLQEVRDQINEIRNFDIKGALEREIDRDGTIRSSLSDPFSNTPTSLDPAPAASSAEAPAPETAAVEAPAQAALAEPDDGTPAFIPPAIAHPPEIPEFLPPGTGRA
jgi:sec-independent protein translocase protein TatB